MRIPSRAAIFITMLLLWPPQRLRAIIFIFTSDPAYNTTAPTGELGNSGWQWQGRWSGCLGTPIGPHHFITAQHVGGQVGDPFILGGISYTTKVYSDDTKSDLRIWAISGTFPTWAPVYRGSDEVGKSLIVMGVGLSRGAEVRVNGELKGWQWGGGGGILRWGQNIVTSADDYGPGLGSLLRAEFDVGAGTNEAHLASGDSGGAVFIQEGGVWKLAGINFATLYVRI